MAAPCLSFVKVEGVPAVIKKGLKKEEAEALKTKLTEAGGKARCPGAGGSAVRLNICLLPLTDADSWLPSRVLQVALL